MILVQIRKFIGPEFSIRPDSPSVDFVSVSKDDSCFFWDNKFFDFVSFWNTRKINFFENEDIFLWLNSLLESFFFDLILIIVLLILRLFLSLILVLIFLLFFIWVVIIGCIIVVILCCLFISILVCVHLLFLWNISHSKLSNFYKFLPYQFYLFTSIIYSNS